jgi:hypothetical protein
MAAQKPIFIDQGTTFYTEVQVSDLDSGALFDLTNFLARGSLRKHYASSNSVSFTCTVNNEIGTIFLTLTANQTSLIKSGRYVYDVEIYDANNTVYRIVEGLVTVTPEVTK